MINHLLSKANSDEVIGTVTVAKDVVEKSDYQKEDLTSFKKKLEEEVVKLTAAKNRKQKSDETAVVDSLEESRDNAYKAFTFTLRAMKLRPDETLANSALTIFEIVKRHGLTLYSLANNEQTSKTNSLIDELSKPKNMAAMVGSIILGVYTEMKEAHLTYLNGVANKEKVDSENEDTERVVKTKKATRLVFDQMINHLNSLSIIDESAELATLCKSISSIIDKANTNIHRRMNGGKNDPLED